MLSSADLWRATFCLPTSPQASGIPDIPLSRRAHSVFLEAERSASYLTKLEQLMTNQPQFGFAIAYVPDIQAAKRFYVDKLGLEVEADFPNFVQFKSKAGATFAVAPTADSMDGIGQTELWWLVDDADAAFTDLSSKTEISASLRQMPFGKCFGIKDAAGQPRYFLELPKQAQASAQ